ncbi:hypothetical protein ABZW11_26530 [Nonomuraea sp. NPDC004580]|uniref:hypothetical protein n=1 Tax=Nonomuraea sp. NPDC004580 TaxID=3154552 RepID=UPI0033BA758C
MCPGPCANQARKAWEAYDQAITRHDYETLLHHDALEHHRALLTAWHPPLALPIEPAPPARPEPPTIPIPTGAPIWCPRCRSTIRNALYRLNELAPVIYADVTGHRGAAPTGPNGTKPLSPAQVIERLDEMYGDLATVASQWKEYRRHPVRPSLSRGADARNVVVAYLLEQLDNILLHPGSVEFGLSVLRWEKRLAELAKADPVSRRSPIECPRCRERQVRREDDGYYKCGSCGRLLNQEEYDRHRWQQAEEHDHEQQEAHA